MSRVSNIMICGLRGERHIDKINEWLLEWGEKIEDVSNKAGGSKHLGTTILLGAFNHFPDEVFIDFLKTIQWEWETDLFIQGEDDMRFSQIPLAKGWRHTEPPERWKQFYGTGAMKWEI